MQYYTKDVAQTCNVTVNTVRNWCRDYGQFLSEGATVTTGNRFFSGRDLEVFKYIATLRAENMQRTAILQRLSETTFPEVDTEPEADSAIVTQNAPITPHVTPAPIVAVDYLQALERRLERLERSTQPSYLTGIGIGFLAACFLFLLLIGLAVLYGGFR